LLVIQILDWTDRDWVSAWTGQTWIVLKLRRGRFWGGC